MAFFKSLLEISLVLVLPLIFLVFVLFFLFEAGSLTIAAFDRLGTLCEPGGP